MNSVVEDTNKSVDGRARLCRQTAGLDVPEDELGSGAVNKEYHSVPRTLIKPGVPWSPVGWGSSFPFMSTVRSTQSERTPTIRCLQHHSLAIGPHSGGVVGLDSGVVGAVEVEAVNSAHSLLPYIHLLGHRDIQYSTGPSGVS